MGKLLQNTILFGNTLYFVCITREERDVISFFTYDYFVEKSFAC